MCEEKRAIAQLPRMLEKVRELVVVLIGEGALSQDLGISAANTTSDGGVRGSRNSRICKQ